MPGRTLSPCDKQEATPDTVPSLRPLPPPSLALSLTRFSSWYPRFRRHAPKATIIDTCLLEPGFLPWLEQDGIVLPEGSDGPQTGQGDDADSDWDVDGEEDEEEVQAPSFPKLDAAIRDAIAKYDGAVFPKLDWSAPRDAAWMVPGNTLRCTTAADIYLLLKSSDFVTKDVEQLQELHAAAGSSDQADVKLILKQYFTLPTSHEFRCFVRDGHFVAACQRDNIFFEHLQPSSIRSTIKSMLFDFWTRVLNAPSTITTPVSSLGDLEANRMDSAVGLSSYVFDAYLTRDMTRVFLIDINPWLERTDPLLWSWEEVDALAEDELLRQRHLAGQDTILSSSSRQATDGSWSGTAPSSDSVISECDEGRHVISLRIIGSEAEATQSQRGPTYASNMVPSDMVNASEGRGLAEFEKEWREQVAEAAREGATY